MKLKMYYAATQNSKKYRINYNDKKKKKKRKKCSFSSKNVIFNDLKLLEFSKNNYILVFNGSLRI